MSFLDDVIGIQWNLFKTFVEGLALIEDADLKKKIISVLDSLHFSRPLQSDSCNI